MPQFDPEAFGDMVVTTVKSAMVPVLERLAATEARLALALEQNAMLPTLRDRVVAVETKAALPHPAEAVAAELRERLAGIEARVNADVLTKEFGTLRERVAAVEARAQVPGPAGPAGKDGRDGKDGADGFGFEEVIAEQVDERTVAFKGVRGDRVKEFGRMKSPAMVQRGVWSEGKSYEHGDVVTWGGSQWHANETTSLKPGEGLKAWTLVVKRGRDGRDGKDAVTLPVVSVGAGQ